MSNSISTGQTAAALFTPEAERLRSQSAAASNKPVSLPTKQGSNLKQGAKTDDSLGNSASPGYEFMGGKKKNGSDADKQGSNPFAPAQAENSTGAKAANIVRLQIGWETLLVVQRKICEKAKNIITSIEAPVKYAVERRGKSTRLKSRGCIVDLQSAENTLSQQDESDEEKESA